MFRMVVSGKASNYREAAQGVTDYVGFFTLTYRGFMDDNKTDKTFIVLVRHNQAEFARKQAEKGYTIIVEARGLRAWVDKEGIVNLALELVNLNIP